MLKAARLVSGSNLLLLATVATTLFAQTTLSPKGSQINSAPIISAARI